MNPQPPPPTVASTGQILGRVHAADSYSVSTTRIRCRSPARGAARAVRLAPAAHRQLRGIGQQKIAPVDVQPDVFVTRGLAATYVGNGGAGKVNGVAVAVRDHLDHVRVGELGGSSIRFFSVPIGDARASSAGPNRRVDGRRVDQRLVALDVDHRPRRGRPRPPRPRGRCPRRGPGGSSARFGAEVARRAAIRSSSVAMRLVKIGSRAAGSLVDVLEHGLARRGARPCRESGRRRTGQG
jgi:hypothetical protein